MEFWRGEAYTAYVDHLERTGGFYYEVKRSTNTVRSKLSLIYFAIWTEMG